MNPRQGKCFEEYKWCFICSLLRKQEMKRTIATVNHSKRKWWKNSTAWIGFLWDESPEIVDQKETSGMNEPFKDLKRNYIDWETKTPLCLQFSWQIFSFYRDENVFMMLYFYFSILMCLFHQNVEQEDTFLHLTCVVCSIPRLRQHHPQKKLLEK